MVSGEIGDKSFERLNNAIQQDISIGNISQPGQCLRERTGISVYDPSLTDRAYCNIHTNHWQHMCDTPELKLYQLHGNFH